MFLDGRNCIGQAGSGGFCGGSVQVDDQNLGWTSARLGPMNEGEISTALEGAFLRGVPLSLDLYVEVLAGHEAALKASLDADADDALLCVLADDGDVAMLLVDWLGVVHRNEEALERVKAMWRDNCEVNVQKLVPIFVEHISQSNLGVAGIKWIPQGSTGEQPDL